MPHRRLPLLAVLLLLLAACTGETALDEPGEPEEAAETPAAEERLPELAGVADLVEQVVPSVVAITVTGGPGLPIEPGPLPGEPPPGEPFPDEPPFEEPLPGDPLPGDPDDPGDPGAPGAEGTAGQRLQVPLPEGEGQGSGIIWADDLVITNAHVIAVGDEISVALADGSRADAEVVASDERTDVAVLRVLDTADLPAADFREQLPRVGDVAVAIGSPLGLENTVTSGVVSGLERSIPGAVEAGIPALSGLIQTDAALSPGSSGGALVDAEGRVIGMNVAFIPPQLQAVSIGFAIPAAVVIDVAEQLLERGEVRHAFLGLQLAPLTGAIRDRLGLDAEEGALVLGVGEGSPAQEAGIEAGDVVTALDDDAVRDLGDLTALLRQRDPGDEVAVTVVRDGEERTIDVTLVERPDEPGEVDTGDLGEQLPGAVAP
jgi:serine protease Do